MYKRRPNESDKVIQLKRMANVLNHRVRQNLRRCMGKFKEMPRKEKVSRTQASSQIQNRDIPKLNLHEVVQPPVFSDVYSSIRPIQSTKVSARRVVKLQERTPSPEYHQIIQHSPEPKKQKCVQFEDPYHNLKLESLDQEISKKIKQLCIIEEKPQPRKSIKQQRR